MKSWNLANKVVRLSGSCLLRHYKHTQPEYTDAYHQEQATALGVSGYVVRYALKLKRLKISRKKTLLSLERNVKHRNEYLTSLNHIPSNKRVYVDETGFDAPFMATV